MVQQDGSVLVTWPPFSPANQENVTNFVVLAERKGDPEPPKVCPGEGLVPHRNDSSVGR